MQKLEKIIQQFTLRLAQIGQLALVLVMLVIVANILMRAWWVPLKGSYELVEILGAILLSLGVAHCAAHRGHVAVSFLVDKMAPRKRAVIDMITTLFFAVIMSYVTWGMIEYAGKMYNRGYATTSLNIPLFPVYYLVSFGLILLFVVIVMQLLQAILAIFKGGEYQ
ncbi:MAG: TRAP transporter small permease [Desulfovermiculus sp.]|nr:TRAP transporter small permease [Desulfovermiculus sp.]